MGNTTYGSNGTAYQQLGNTTYGSNGTTAQQLGNTTYMNNGTTYQQLGNTNKGILLAGGGFPSSILKRKQYLPQPSPLNSAAYEGCQGETIDLGIAVGGVLGKPGQDNALWFPSSVRYAKDGTTSIYPHIILDRSKPGLIAVNMNGIRFVNEAVSYHEFVRAMYKTPFEGASVPAILICGKGFIWKYNFGLIRPRTPALFNYIQEGYLYEASSIDELAIKVGIDALTLNRTVATFNNDASSGRDNAFLKGENIYDRSNGDPNNHPNPCLGPIRARLFTPSRCIQRP